MPRGRNRELVAWGLSPLPSCYHGKGGFAQKAGPSGNYDLRCNSLCLGRIHLLEDKQGRRPRAIGTAVRRRNAQGVCGNFLTEAVVVRRFRGGTERQERGAGRWRRRFADGFAKRCDGEPAVFIRQSVVTPRQGNAEELYAVVAPAVVIRPVRRHTAERSDQPVGNVSARKELVRNLVLGSIVEKQARFRGDISWPCLQCGNIGASRHFSNLNAMPQPADAANGQNSRRRNYTNGNKRTYQASMLTD